MTTREMRKKLAEYCDSMPHCYDCALNSTPESRACWAINDEKIIVEDYDKVFGKHSKPDPLAIPMEQVAMIEEDADTIIKIKSNKKIDNISVYFKED